MLTISVFSRTTGRIKRVISGSEDVLAMQPIGPDEGVIAGDVDARTHYVANGQVVAMPPKPSEHHQFDFAVKRWVDPRTPETEWPLVRAKRDQLLMASDWTQLPDVPVATKEAWATYRQALRDVTTQPDPFNVQWPVVPA